MLCVSTLTMAPVFARSRRCAGVRVFLLRPERPHGVCLLRRDGCRSAARDARRPGGCAPVRGAPGRRSRLRARVDPKAVARDPLPAVGVTAVLALQGFVSPLTGAPIFTVITTRTPAAFRTKVAIRPTRADVPHGPVRPGCRRSTDQRARGKNGLGDRRGRIPGGDRAVRHLRHPKPGPGRSCRSRVRCRTP